MFKGKVAIITGAGGGLGQAFTRKFATEGAIMVLTATSSAKIKKIEEDIEKTGVEYTLFVLDVTNKEQVEDMMDKVVRKYGKIDILVNNAGGSLLTPKKLEDIEEKHWDLVLDVNLKGAFFCCQAAIPYMAEKRYGKIINMSSIGGRAPSLVTGTAYAAAKGGIISFTRRLAKEVGNRGINVNTIAPGTILSGQRMIDLWNDMTEAEKDNILQSIPLGRLSTAEEQADAVAFLASDLSSYITGAVIDVNGGRFMG